MALPAGLALAASNVAGRVKATEKSPPKDDLVLKVDGKKLSGWTDILVQLGVDRMPNIFMITATENSPVYSDAVAIQEGQACTISLGEDLVITGYVDAVISAYGEGEHAVRIQGRGKCQDLVDCSAEWQGSQISGANALEIATKLAAPYGIKASNLGPAGEPVPQFNINVGETPADILELVTRHAGLLYFEGPDGNLILAQAGTDKAGSGFEEGKNVQAASVVRSQAQRYSDYKCSLISVDTSGLFEKNDGAFAAAAKDPNIKRNRKLYSVAEGVAGSLELADKRVKWEASRRAGRGRQVMITVDNWRDAKGKLWKPNTLAPVTLPRLKVKEAGLCIAQVTFRLSLGTGRTADVLLMPKDAFLTQPIQLQPQIVGLTPAPAPAAPAPATGN